MDCFICQEIEGDYDIIDADGTKKAICPDCLREGPIYEECGSCGTFAYEQDGLIRGCKLTRRNVCVNCMKDKDYFTCAVCDDLMPSGAEGDCGGGVCFQCDTSVAKDKYEDDAYKNKQAGNIITSERTFGVETEISGGDIDRQGIAQEIDDAFAVVRDGSVNGLRAEVVSPILRGKRGESAMRNVLTRLEDFNCSADESCGLHVHLGGDGFYESPEFRVFSHGDLEKLGPKLAFRMAHGTEKIEDTIVFSPELSKKFESWWGIGRKKDQAQTLAREYLNRIDLEAKEKKTDCGVIGEAGSKGYLCWRYETLNLNENQWSNQGVRAVRFFIVSGVNAEKYKKELSAYPKKYEAAKKKLKDISRQMDEFRSKIYNGDGEVLKAETLKYEKNKEALRALEADVRFGRPDKHKNWVVYSKPKAKKEDTVAMVVTDTSYFERTKRLFMFYAVFSDVILAMLPTSRSRKNRHCQNLTLGFSIYDIRATQNMEELERLWYKTTDNREVKRRKGEKYDNSRYYGVNFHSLFGDKHTVEIRYHNGTVETDKILYWVAFNQLILDSIHSGKINEDQLIDAAEWIKLEDRAQAMIDVLNPPKNIRKYITQRLDYFSNIKTK